MPQLLFPNAAWAEGVEVGMITYAFAPGVLFNINVLPFGTAANHAVIAGVLYFLYNKYIIGKK